MEKSAKIRLIYAIFLGVFTVAVGLAIICVAADIYYTGKDTGVIYSRAIVGERLTALAIPLIFLIAAIILGAVFPLYKVKAARQPESTLDKLKARIPQSGEGDSVEFTAAQNAYKKAAIIRLVAWLVALAAALAGAIATLCYLVDTAQFSGKDVTGEIFNLVKNILPWLCVAFAATIAATVTSGIFASKQVAAAKTMIKNGGQTVAQKAEPKFITVIKSIIAKPAFTWAVRGCIFVLAVTFIILGIVNGGANDVLVKAVNICTECIGLG
ncbi:MAG: hypothetical protein K2J01_00930 [Clostridiales bacterium]|nr:hypothetical protein [Clostridiales bacterium]